MSRRLFYTYALAKSIYEQKKDYIDTFCPFLLKVLPTNRDILNLITIQEKIKDNYSLSIPEHSLKSIITRAKNKRYITVVKWKVRLDEKGIKYLDRLEPESEIDRRINELLEDVKFYLNEPELSLEETYKIVLCFVSENIEPVVEFFDPSGFCRLHIPKTKIRKYEEKLVQYFKIAEKGKSTLYKTLEDIVYGSVISTAVNSQDISAIDQKFKNVQVFLDSNFIFSLFEFDFPEINKPAKELFDLLRIFKFDIRVFDFTVNEMVRLLNSYTEEQFMYVPGISVNSIHSNLKNKGWTVEDVREFIQKIEGKIWSLKIKIEPTNIDFATYIPKREYMDKILEYKPLRPHQTERLRHHDLAIIERIKEIRGSPKRQIEKSKAIFLTSDLRLSRFDFLELSHKENATVCEIIPDRLLTNVLWLKNPTIVKDIPFRTIIAIHSREIFIDRRIWRRFYENVKKLKEEGRIEDKDISMLFYNRYIEEVLLKFDKSDADKITSELILDEIEKKSREIDIETRKKLEKQKILFEDRIAQEIEKQKEWETKLEKIKKNIKLRSERSSGLYTNVVLYVSLSLVLVGIIVIMLSKFSESISRIVVAICGILGFLGVRFDIWRIRSGLRTKLFNVIYKRKLKKLEIEV